jgi:hypothetical protein
MRFIKRESIPFKVQFRNSLFVLISTLLGTQLLRSIGDGSVEEASGSTSAFTGPPGF